MRIVSFVAESNSADWELDPVFMQPGDTIEVELETIGVPTDPVVAG